MKNILLTIKDCETAATATPIVEKTIELASTFSSKVWVLHIVPPSREPPYNVDSEMFLREVATELSHEHDSLQNIAKYIQDKNIEVTPLLLQGPVINTILQESDRLEIDLVVLGFHKHGLLGSVLMDDVGEGLLAKCSRSMMFVHA